MDRISGLPDEVLVKILSFVPTQIAVSTSILSKRWGSLWKWVPKLEDDYSHPALGDFILENLPLRASIIESLCLTLDCGLFLPEDVLSPSNLYTCKSLVTLKLKGMEILVDVPSKGCLPSLKTLQLSHVTYSHEDSLRLLLSYCLVLEDLVIERVRDDNLRAIVVIVPSLQRLTLQIDGSRTDGCEIVTPSLKYFKVDEYGERSSYMIASMPKLEEAEIEVVENIEKLLASVTSVKRLTLCPLFNNREESVYCAGIVFDQLEQLKLDIKDDDWSLLLVWLLKTSPKLRVLNLHVDVRSSHFEVYEPADWKKKGSSAPECLERSLETLEFAGYSGRQEERDVLSFIFQNALCLKSISISHA